MVGGWLVQQWPSVPWDVRELLAVDPQNLWIRLRLEVFAVLGAPPHWKEEETASPQAAPAMLGILVWKVPTSQCLAAFFLLLVLHRKPRILNVLPIFKTVLPFTLSWGFSHAASVSGYGLRDTLRDGLLVTCKVPCNAAMCSWHKSSGPSIPETIFLYHT